MCPDRVLETVSFLSEQFPTPSHVALLHDIVPVVRNSDLKQAVLNKTFVMYQDKYRHTVVQTLHFTYSMQQVLNGNRRDTRAYT